MKHIRLLVRSLLVMLIVLGSKSLRAQDIQNGKASDPQSVYSLADLSEIEMEEQVEGQTRICIPLPVLTWPPVVDVVDTNVTIGNATLPAGPTHITACTQDVCINIAGTVEGAPGAESQLHIEAAAGRTVTFNILGDTRFVGSSTGEDLLIVFRGDGTVIFQFDVSAITLTFGKNGVSGGSVKSFLITNCPASDTDPIPTVMFQRTPGSGCTGIPAAGDVGIVYEQNALFMFASAGGNLSARTAQGCAHVVFRPSNSGAGRMFLEIQNEAAFVIAGCAVNPVYTPDACVPANFVLADFDLTTPVFQDFRMEVTQNLACSPTATCGGDLMVLNNNVTMGELLIDPWCNLGTREDPNFIGTFNGIRYGFVIGANGTLTVGDNTSFDYVELGLMICPDVVFLDLVPLHSSLKKRNPAALTIDGSNNPIALHANINLGINSGLFFRSGVDVNGNIEVPFGDPFEFTIDFSLRTPGAGNTVLSVEGPLDVFGSDVQNPLDDQLYTANSKIEILSFHVLLDAELFNCCNEGCFPRKSFLTQIDGTYYRYNAASFFIHDNMTLNNVTLAHTDENHNVYEKNDVLSEPTYVGGDVVPCVENPAVPYMAFINSALLVQTDVAFTGFDLLVPNGSFPVDNILTPCGSNTSRFVFYQNGVACDHGFGRNMILGTLQGSVSCDGCTVINANTQLDVMQITECADDPANVHLLNFQVTQNLPCSTFEIFCCTGGICPAAVDPCGVDLQTAIHSVFLGNQSNISIGTQTAVTSSACVGITLAPMIHSKKCISKAPTVLNSHPLLQICGNFFAFETHGGITCIPQDSPVTGTGGIFVDSDGTLAICPSYRAFFGTVVTKSFDGSVVNGFGTVNLPPRQIVWAPGIGVADWNINLADPLRQQTIPTSTCDPLIYVPIVNSGEYYSEYKLDWLTTQKDYANFCSYKTGLYTPCTFPPVTCRNISTLPAVLGTVDQFQITGSRLGDPAHIEVIGGLIREFIYLSSGHSGEEPTSVIVLSQQGTIGLGTAHRNPQSLYGSIVLGANGVTVIANGDGQVNLNEDVIIDNIWQIARGPDFDGNTLTISSENESTIRVVSGACLDLSQFQEGDTIQLAGNVQLILEPGSCILFGGSGFAIPCGACDQEPTTGATLSVVDQASIVLEPVVKTNSLVPVVNPGEACDPHPEVNYDLINPVRVRLIGKGTISLTDNAYFNVPNFAFLGIETLKPCTSCDGEPETTPCSLDNCEVPYTDITIELLGSAKFNIGNNTTDLGGAVQIGNVQPHTFSSDCGTQNASVLFTLNLNGDETRFSIGTQGFVGFGVGIADKSSPIPNNWLVSSLYNVDLINLLVPNGTFAHERIFSGEDEKASLLAFSNDDATVYNFVFTPITVDPLNPNEPLFMIDIAPTTFLGGGNMALINSTVPIHPVIRCVDGVMTASLTVSLLASTPMFEGAFVGSTAADLFTFLRVPTIPTVITVSGPATDALGIANTAISDQNNQIRLGYIDNCLIGRVYGVTISGDGDYQTKQTHAVAVGAIPILIDGTPPTPLVDCANPCSLPCITPGSPGGPRPIIIIYDQLGVVL